MYDSIVILGPTASGKTAVSIELAKMINTEIINADSMYVYKYMNIGTAKPTMEEMQNIKHHLIDIIDPDYRFTVSEFRSRANECVKAVWSKGKIPIIVGGTGFYIDSLINDYTYATVNNDNNIRDKYEKLAKEKGNEYVYDILKSYDVDSASKLHYNDLKRVIRAIEIYELSGKTKYEINNIKSDNVVLKNPLIIGLNTDRDSLYSKINKRVDIMLDNGLIYEVKYLLDMGYPINCQSMKAIGYKEIIDYLYHNIDLDTCIEKIKQHSRNYAKRQITYFKRNNRIVWLDSFKTNSVSLAKEINNIYNKKVR